MKNLNLYEVQLENAVEGQTLLHHIRAKDEDDATARAIKHWQDRAVLKVTFLRACNVFETRQQLAKDLLPVPDPTDVRVERA